jgi:hypothetical protein
MKQASRSEPNLSLRKHLDARQDLYRALAEQIWNPENLLREVDR